MNISPTKTGRSQTQSCFLLGVAAKRFDHLIAEAEAAAVQQPSGVPITKQSGKPAKLQTSPFLLP